MWFNSHKINFKLQHVALINYIYLFIDDIGAPSVMVPAHVLYTRALNIQENQTTSQISHIAHFCYYIIYVSLNGNSSGNY